MKFYKHILLLPALILSVLLTSCEDKFDYSSQIIGEGEGLVTATLEFKPSVTNLGGSRTVGNAISEIKTLAVVIYTAEGEFVDLIPNVKTTDYKYQDLTSTEKPYDYPTGPDGEDISSDNATAKVQFEMKLPYGKYYMYAVANLGRELKEEEVQTIEALKAIRCTWNANNISANAQMFGYFTNDVTNGNTAFTETDPTVTVNQKNVALHSWIKRLASKVTIAFNGEGLHQGIVVYIHNVSIRQIPKTCTLGEGNKPTAEDQVTPALFNESVPDTAQVLYYDNEGFTNAKSNYDYAGEKYLRWLQVANGAGPNNDGHLCYNNHGVNSPALFFYENMQGVDPDKPKDQQRDKVGDNVVPPGTELKPGYTYEDYKDDVEYGTFIEVEAYYQCNIAPSSSGPIRYRFMLGQNETDNYNAIRNHHYKLTLGFQGYANQPDWHIEYVKKSPEIDAPEIYIPYTYNTSVSCPITFYGDLTALEAEIIENNWAPYDSTTTDGVAPATVGTTNFNLRTLQFNWFRDVYMNGNAYTVDVRNTLLNFTRNLTQSDNSELSSGYLYGRHYTGFCHLDDNGDEITSQRYYVTPIWAGFLRLQVPEVYESETSVPILPAIIVYNRPDVGKGEHYRRQAALTDFRNYYYGRSVTDADENATYGANNGQGNGYKPGTDLHARVFNIANPTSDNTNRGRNAYTVEKGKDAKGKEYTVVTMNLWTQPKSMCGNSGFSGNNPYEDYNRKAVIRFTATFDDDGVTKVVKKDVTVYQSKRLVNPKAVWRSHDKPNPFNVTVYERDVNGAQNAFQPLVSRGEWRARIKQVSEGANGFITLAKGAVTGANEIVGKTLSEVAFTINFAGPIGFNESKCAIIEVTYHGNTCVHNIFVRQGYHQPMQITTGGAYWSSYNLFSCDANTGYGTRDGDVQSVLTRNPLSFGAFFKRLNYAQAISVSNIKRTGSGAVNSAGFGPLQYPGITSTTYPDLNARFEVTRFAKTDPTETFTWNEISGNTKDPSYHWANFKFTGDTRTYTVPTIDDFRALQSADFGIGVLYGDGASVPADKTETAYGFLDEENETTSSDMGMRGFICYNSTNAHQVFFPIGTSGLGRRTVQGVGNLNQRGTLRYGSMSSNFPLGLNTLRPIPMNIANAPGSIYWAYQGTNTGATNPDEIPIAWDMNYFDLNFTSISAAVVSRHDGMPTTILTAAQAAREGNDGDALPIRLVTKTP